MIMDHEGWTLFWLRILHACCDAGRAGPFPLAFQFSTTRSLFFFFFFFFLIIDEMSSPAGGCCHFLMFHVFVVSLH